MSKLSTYFEPFRRNVIGINQTFESPFGVQKITYADWTASGRMYKPIEEIILKEIAPFVGNTHTETTVTGCSMTEAYQKAKQIIKDHVNANESDILISSNSGMTGVVNKFQRILGLKIHERFMPEIHFGKNQRPVVFVSHMEHHSNQTSWLETTADVEIIRADQKGLMDLNDLKLKLDKFKDRETIIAAITSCSNVTGIFTPYHEVAKLVHKYGGYCFVDFAASAPYIPINMHPEDKDAYLDAIYFSPHKFLGGPSSSGILIFNPKLYQNRIPDNPGGGTVDWTNPWGEHRYHEEIEAREDGGTPAFIQTMRVALCVKLKEEMGPDKMLKREEELMEVIWNKLSRVDGLHILADKIKDRLGVFSFYIDDLHYNLGVKLLNDRFGIQVRGGCSCAGTYGHYLLHVTPEQSHQITDLIDEGDLTEKPGWIRLSIHPIMTDEEIDLICNAIKEVATHHKKWAQNYSYNSHTNEYHHVSENLNGMEMVEKWFEKSLV